MQFQVTAVRLDSNTIVADVHSGGYDVIIRMDIAEVNEYLPTLYDFISLPNYWRACEIDDYQARQDLPGFIHQSTYLLSQLRDAIRLKEIEAIIYEHDEVEIDNTLFTGAFLEPHQCDHLHSLITQYGDGRVETEKLK